MFNWPWRTLVLTATGVIVLTAFLVPDPSPERLSSLSTDDLVRLLASPREVVRQAAAGQLIARAKTVVSELVRSTQRATGEQLREILGILEELMLASDPQVAESAELALEELVELGSPDSRQLAARVLQRNSTLRHTRSVARVEELGGRVLVVLGNETSMVEVSDDPAPGSSGMGRSRPTTRIVVLDQNWQGGDAGLRHISRLFPGDSLILHLTDDAPITSSALLNLRAQRSRTTVRRPEQGCLGVSYRDDVHEPVIAGVTSQSPAERAGLRGDDVVVALNGKPIARVRELIDWTTRDHSAAEMIELTVRRRGATVRMKFALGTDFGTGECRCVED